MKTSLDLALLLMFVYFFITLSHNTSSEKLPKYKILYLQERIQPWSWWFKYRNPERKRTRYCSHPVIVSSKQVCLDF